MPGMPEFSAGQCASRSYDALVCNREAHLAQPQPGGGSSGSTPELRRRNLFRGIMRKEFRTGKLNEAIIPPKASAEGSSAGQGATLEAPEPILIPLSRGTTTPRSKFRRQRQDDADLTGFGGAIGWSGE